MTLKEQFESNPVVWGLTLIAAGFTAGFGARGYVLQTSTLPPSETSCTVTGVDTLEEAHDRRIATLQEELVALESKASDHNLIGSYQRTYGEAADRIRSDIEIENANYLAAIDKLNKKCTTTTGSELEEQDATPGP